MKIKIISAMLIYFCISSFTCKKEESPLCAHFYIELTHDTQDNLLTVQTFNGLGPFKIVWSTGSGGNSIDVIKPGKYSVTVTDGNGCVRSKFATVN
ncbi:MAG: hypothetical protein IPO78_02510 [Saprospiraceae bacterium]|nr:hypothetical protein [Saprospiraceae bacterium]MBK9222493.1 hypothetical protein [Saprospiraceae bacterium]MBK9720472.1 hypothetical protein [Saprospiraceae bacterium]MBK9727443.1 hypothetical protein [Saprospiraceae bacterium]